MVEGARVSEAANDSSRSDLPALRVKHFFVCAAILAMYLVLQRGLVPEDVLAGMAPGRATFLTVGLIVSAVLYAVGVTLGLFAIAWRLNGLASLSQPGEWLLLQHLFSLASLVVARFSNLAAAARTSLSLRFEYWSLNDAAVALAHFATVLLLNGLPALVYFWSARRIADTWPWRIVLSLIAIGYVLAAVRGLLSPIRNSFTERLLASMGPYVVLYVPIFVLLVSLTCAMVNDLMKGHRRSWIHWAGALLELAPLAMSIVGLLYWFYF